MTARDDTSPAASLLATATAAEAADRLVDALRAFRALLDIDPKHEPALLGIGRISLLFERYDEALLNFTAVLTRNPACAEAYRGRGLCYLNQGLPDQALSDLARAVSLSPNSLEPLLSLGQASLELRRWDDAERSLRAAYALDPDDPDVCLELARCLLLSDRGAPSDIGALLTAAAPAFPPDDGLFTLLRAELLARQGHRPTAIRLLNRALQLEPELSDDVFRFPTLASLLLSDPNDLA
jgi:tetratricopeptide (TPR) repeat protein